MFIYNEFNPWSQFFCSKCNENCYIKALFLCLIYIIYNLTSEEFLETCGGDQSSPMSWPQLTAAYFSYNWITKLDASLVSPQSLLSNCQLCTIDC